MTFISDNSDITIIDMFPITNEIYMNIHLINGITIILKLCNQYRHPIINTNNFVIKQIPEMKKCIQIPGTKIFALDYYSKYQIEYYGNVIAKINEPNDWFML